MSEEQQKVGEDQSHDTVRGHGMKPEVYEEGQLLLTQFSEGSSTEGLMERITDSKNLWTAYRKVHANKGSPGIDGMTTTSLKAWLEEHEEALRTALLEGKYIPQPVKGVQIPKPKGGVRQLGIPTAVDRLVQQAILQVLDPIFDPTFSEHSYGFRVGRSAHRAIQKATEYVTEGRHIVVDIDIEKFFDRINHDILMEKLAKRIRDKRLLKLIRRYLKAGMMSEGVCVTRNEGTPQGGPLSPLMANILLDDLDKELERRGHCFCRYADDCNIYVSSQAAGDRVKESITQFLGKKLKLKVNQEKSCAAPIAQRKFLGYRIHDEGRIAIAPQSVEKLKEKIREVTPRWTAKSIEEVIEKLNQHLKGWMNYFQLTEGASMLLEIDAWIRRRLRAIKLKQLKKPRTTAKYLQSRGVSEDVSWKIAKSGKGIWRVSKSQGVHRAMRNQWFKELGLCSLKNRWEELTGKLRETAVYGTVCTVV